MSIHVPVLLQEVVEGLTARSTENEDRRNGDKLPSKSISPNSELRTTWYLDGTLGGAGHSLAIAKALNGKVNVIGLDRDNQAIEKAKETLKGKAEIVILENEDYRNLDKVLDSHGIREVDMILLDLGISSDELDHSGRGFSFQKDEPLLMTMGDPEKYPFTAKDIVNRWKEEDIANVIYGYGEERYAYRIAHKIIIYREKKSIETTTELAEIVKSAVPMFHQKFGPRSKIHPATKTFQALRIAVNDELNALREGLRKGYERLAPSGRMAVISFHSLEDRIVKEFYKEKVTKGRGHRVQGTVESQTTPYILNPTPSATIITKKPITASLQEIAENPRSRSAKLRIIEK